MTPDLLTHHGPVWDEPGAPSIDSYGSSAYSILGPLIFLGSMFLGLAYFATTFTPDPKVNLPQNFC